MTSTARRVNGIRDQRVPLSVPVSVAVILLLAAADLATGPGMVLVGLLIVGPCVAAISGRPVQVAAVGALTLAAQLLLSWPDHLWGSLTQALVLGASVGVTVVSALVAGRRLTTARAATAAAERERQLAAIVESSDEAIIGKTLDGLITSWNRGAERMYGYPAADVVGRHMSIIVPADKEVELEDILARVAAGLPTERLETTRCRKDGSTLDVSVSVSPILDDLGRVVGASAAAHDTTAARAAQRELAVSQARKSAMLQSSLDAIVVIDDHGAIVDFNPAAERTFGHPAREAVGRQLDDLLIRPDDAERCRAGQARYLAADRPAGSGRRIELTALRADGTTVPVELTVVRLELTGRPLLMAFIRDLSELRALDAERVKLSGRLAQAERMDSLGQLAGGVAHDFNNLLAVILNYTSLVRGELTAGQVRDDVDAISTAAEQAAGLTRQLLGFGRVEPVNPTDVDVNDVVTSMVTLLRRTMPGNIRLVTHLPPVSPVRAERASLETVVMNLAVNARDAMPDGGRLTIETGEVELSESLLGSDVALVAGRYVRLVVTDNGSGMPEGVRRKAFDPFFTTKAKGHGTGLGLATVYGVARQLGGDASLYSEPGRGTSVSLHLPAVATPLPPSRVTAAVPRVPDPAGARGRTVLLVEDEELLRIAVARVLESEGYVVLAAASAEEALTLADQGGAAVDLLLTDVILSGRSGPELAQLLRARWPGLAVLLASGYTERVLSDSLPPDGSWDLIEKPFSLDGLLARVSRALTNRA